MTPTGSLDFDPLFWDREEDDILRDWGIDPTVADMTSMLSRLQIRAVKDAMLNAGYRLQHDSVPHHQGGGSWTRYAPGQLPPDWMNRPEAG